MICIFRGEINILSELILKDDLISKDALAAKLVWRLESSTNSLGLM